MTLYFGRRTLGLVVLLAMLAAATLSVIRPVAAAHADANGCGPANSVLSHFVPNAPLGYDFLDACDNHDNCYDSGASKDSCDLQFLDDMESVCDGGWVCSLLAKIYYEAVHLFGDSAYDQAQQARLNAMDEEIDDCLDDGDCVADVADEFGLDDWVDQTVACGDDDACQAQVDDSYEQAQPTDPCSVSDCSTDPDNPDPGTGDPGDPGDPGDGGGGGGGGGGDCGGDYQAPDVSGWNVSPDLIEC